MGAPGWPEFACCTASIARVRVVLMLNRSRFGWLTLAPVAGRMAPADLSSVFDAPRYRTDEVILRQKESRRSRARRIVVREVLRDCVGSSSVAGGHPGREGKITAPPAGCQSG